MKYREEDFNTYGMLNDRENELSLDDLIALIDDAQSDIKKRDRVDVRRAETQRAIDCDTKILYGDLASAAKYLLDIHSRYPKAKLDEHWTGYETMTMEFSWWEDQNDSEYRWALLEKLSHTVRARRERERSNHNKRLQNQIEELRKQLK